LFKIIAKTRRTAPRLRVGKTQRIKDRQAGLTVRACPPYSQPVFCRILLLALCLLSSARAVGTAQPPASAVVFAEQNHGAVQGYDVDASAVRAMVDRLVESITGKSSTQAAWRALVSPTDRVGVKISTKGGPVLATHPAIIAAVLDGLESAGVPRGNIIVWDGVHGPGDVDPKAPVSAAVLGKLIWGDLKFKAGKEGTSSLSYLSRVLTGKLTKIINLPVMCASEGNGIAGAVYNLTVSNLDNWRRLTQPPNCGDPDLAELYSDPRLGPKVVLTIMDGLVAQFAGGPEFRPNYAFTHATLYASRDGVAVDATALAKLDEWRQQAKLPPVTPNAAYLKSAEQIGCGIADPQRIIVTKLP
jgi:uncharacterized protein (DUF362 family)